MGVALSCRRVQIGGFDQPPCSCGEVGLGRQRGGALGEHGCGLGRAAGVEPGGRGLELARDRLVRSLGPATQMKGALVRVVERLCEREVDRTSLGGGVHVEQRRSEERMREPQGSSAGIHHCG